MSLRLALILSICLLCSSHAAAEYTIAMIGTGDVGSALGPAFAAQGHKVVYGSRNPDRDRVRELVARTGNGAAAASQRDAARDADIVVLAVPPLLVESITRNLGDLDGKIVIDPTNPMTLVDGRFERAIGFDTSNTELIQQAAPGSRVVKAFSTISWQTMVDPSLAGGPVSVPLAGNDAAAKATVAELVAAMGIEAIDVGEARDARYVEALLLLWINNRFSARPAFDYHLRRQPQ